MRHVERGRPPRGLHPVDDAGHLTVGPEHVADVEVAVQERPVVRRRRAVEDRERLGPRFGPAGPVRHDALLGHRPGLVVAWTLRTGVDRVDADQRAGQPVQHGVVAPGELEAAGHRRHQVGRVAGRGAVGVRRDAARCRDARAGQQVLHGRLTRDESGSVPAPRLPRHQPQHGLLSVGGGEAQHGGGPAAAQRVDPAYLPAPRALRPRGPLLRHGTILAPTAAGPATRWLPGCAVLGAGLSDRGSRRRRAPAGSVPSGGRSVPGGRACRDHARGSGCRCVDAEPVAVRCSPDVHAWLGLSVSPAGAVGLGAVLEAGELAEVPDPGLRLFGWSSLSRPRRRVVDVHPARCRRRPREGAGGGAEVEQLAQPVWDLVGVDGYVGLQVDHRLDRHVGVAEELDWPGRG